MHHVHTKSQLLTGLRTLLGVYNMQGHVLLAASCCDIFRGQSFVKVLALSSPVQIPHCSVQCSGPHVQQIE